MTGSRLLSDEDVKDIREMYHRREGETWSMDKIARLFGISQGTVQRVIYKKTPYEEKD